MSTRARRSAGAGLPARCGLCGSRHCDQPGGPACWEAQAKRLEDQ
jgi:hypothetical protein